MTRVWLLIGALIVGGAACGGRAAGDSECQKMCRSVRDKLINNFGVQPERVNCDDDKWRDATCEECIEIFRDEFDVQPTTSCD